MKLKSLKEYIGDGLSKTKPIFKNKTNILKFYFLEFLYIITLPLVITGPLVRLAYYNMVKNVSNGYKSYNVFDNFKSLADTKVVTKAILSSLIKDSINFSILLVLVLLSAPFFGLGWVLYINSGETTYFIIGVIPLSIMVLGYVYYLLFMHMPLTQVIVENPNISICETLRLSYTSYSKSDKHQIPLMYLFEYLFKGIILGLILSLIALEYNGFDYIMIFMVLLLSIYLFFIPKCTLSNLVSRRDARVDIIKNYNSKDVEDYSERVFKLLNIDNSNKDNTDSKKKDKKKKDKDIEEVKDITLDEASIEVKEDESIINPNLVLEDNDDLDDSIDFLDETIDESDSIEEIQEEKEIEQKPFEQHDVEFEAAVQKTIDFNELDSESTNNTIESTEQVVESSNEEIKEDNSEVVEETTEEVEAHETQEVESIEQEETTDTTIEESNEQAIESTNDIVTQEEITSTESNLDSSIDNQEEVETLEKPKKRGRKKKSEASSENQE